ncbi:DUF1702 family protein [Fictibacillus enclensis]|uniref:DUF1702 family protein n=1 Tax=Fictibacillus enclensis TaxID=1017270 RepID=UPI0025A1C3EF|nr:DUF1702 family protein [Fictibacillus enclensis]MDM5335830.1 DUF1702 family protein [Fictibacillus enclensis]
MKLNLILFILVLAVLWFILFTLRRELKKFDITPLLQTNQTFFASRFHHIYSTFKMGFIFYLGSFCRLSSAEKKIKQNIPLFFQGFAYEGLAMSYAARLSITTRKPTCLPEKQFQSADRFLYQLYVGIGWWIHTLHAYKQKPFDKWRNRIPSKYFPIVYDGVGFKTGIFNYTSPTDICAKFSSFREPEQRVCFQGLGRSIWFLCHFNFQKACTIIHEFPANHRRDIYSGLGIACSYSLFDDLKICLNLIPLIDEENRTAFIQGVSFGLYARFKNDKNHWEQVVNSSNSFAMISHWMQMIERAHENCDLVNPENFYYAWIDEVRKRISIHTKQSEVTTL